MAFFKNIYKQEKGATSVLVIFMMIVLVTLGAFTIASADVNYRLSQSAKQWNVEYYKLEDMGEEYVMNVDMVLTEALSDSVAYIMDKGYENPTYTNIPNDLQTEIYTNFIKKNNQEAVDFAFRQVYMYNSLKGLEELKNTYNTQMVTPMQEGNSINKITTEIDFASNTDPDSNLKIVLEIRPLDGYILEYEQGETEIFQEENIAKYDIIEWKQWNKPIELGHEVGVWN